MDAQAVLIFTGHTGHFVGFVMLQLKYSGRYFKQKTQMRQALIFFINTFLFTNHYNSYSIFLIQNIFCNFKTLRFSVPQTIIPHFTACGDGTNHLQLNLRIDCYFFPFLWGMNEKPNCTQYDRGSPSYKGVQIGFSFIPQRNGKNWHSILIINFPVRFSSQI